jgi:hypothetical protein
VKLRDRARITTMLCACSGALVSSSYALAPDSVANLPIESGLVSNSPAKKPGNQSPHDSRSLEF